MGIYPHKSPFLGKFSYTSRMDQFKAVLLDADGVVNDGALFSLEKDYGVAPERLQPFFKNVFPDCLIGKADLKDVLGSYLYEWGWKGTVDSLIEYWFKSTSNTQEGVVNMIIKLKTAGYPVYLCTNQEKNRLQYMRQQMGFSDLFTGIYASCEVGVSKPAPEFFKKVLKDLAPIKPAEILYWDDSRRNVEAANALGISAHHFSYSDDFVGKMNKMLSF